MTKYSIDGGRLLADGRAVEMIPSPYVSGRFAAPPPILVMHFTYGASARSSAEWFRAAENKGSSAHVVIERDGATLQCVPFDVVAWHAGGSSWKGKTNLNRTSIGIEMANWGYLKRKGDGWASYTGAPIADPVIAVHRNGNPDGSRSPIGWEPYPEAQMRALLGVARALVAGYGITEIVGHDDIAPTRKSDPGPAFDMARFRAAVLGSGRDQDGAPTATVRPTDGLNLRSGPGTGFSILELLAAGTVVRPVERDGRWLSVEVLDGEGRPRRTGWVNGAYVA